jgi:PTH1 family peptidyl-tRNA hydrolase
VRIIAGLGNPGSEYEGSRHNVGFLVIAGLAKERSIRLEAGPGDFMAGRGRMEGADVLLVMPLTYMNLSGGAIARVLEWTGAAIDDVLVVCDDVNLPLGQLRMRASGSAGGHNGLASIISTLGSEAFARLRVGVGPPEANEDLADYVLDRFAADEAEAVDEMLERARAAVRELLRNGIGEAMTLYNRRLESEEEV